MMKREERMRETKQIGNKYIYIYIYSILIRNIDSNIAKNRLV